MALMDTDEMKKIANRIMELCQKEGMTFRDAAMTLDIAKQRIFEGKEQAMEEAGGYKLKFKPF